VSAPYSSFLEAVVKTVEVAKVRRDYSVPVSVLPTALPTIQK
jgi:hypothetical protein